VRIWQYKGSGLPQWPYKKRVYYVGILGRFGFPLIFMKKIIYFAFVFLLLFSFQSAVATDCVRLENSLYPGARDSSVSSLQSFLQSTGDYTDSQISGYFGLSTQQAVQRFQKRTGIVSTGTPSTTGYGAVGPATRKAMNAYCSNSAPVESTPNVAVVEPSAVSSVSAQSYRSSELPITRTLTLRSKGDDVRLLQEFLKNQGDYTYPEVTGYFGPVTQEAVQKFQARTGVVSDGSPQTTGFGLVGPSTRRVLAEEMTRDIPTIASSEQEPSDGTPSSPNFIPPSVTTPPTRPLSPVAPHPFITMSASPSQIKRGESSTITWRSSITYPCIGNFADKEGAYVSVPKVGSMVVSPFGTFSYRIECSNDLGKGSSAVVEVKVQPILTESQIQALVALMQSFGIPQSAIDDVDAVLRGYSSSSTGHVQTSEARLKSLIGLLESFGADQRTIDVIRSILTRNGGAVDPIPERSAQVTLTASPSTVSAGESVNLTWNSKNALVCSQPIRVTEKGSVNWEQHLGYSAGQTEGIATLVPYPLSDWRDFGGFARYRWLVGCRGLFYPEEIAVAEVSIQIKSVQLPQANLTASPTSGRAPLAVTFTANLESFLSVSQPDGSVQLDFGDGQQGILCKPNLSGVSACTASWVGLHTYRNAGTYDAKLIWQSNFGNSSVLDTVQITVDSQNTTVPKPPEQNIVINGFNVYSADLIFGNDGMRMYFGGWMNKGQRHDNIYVADCSEDGSTCSNIRTVIDATAKGFNHLNDPSIVRLVDSNNTGRGYYIMYLTGVEEGEDGLVAGNNHLYYSTSWANNGINWSTPKLLLRHHWLPSATVNGKGEVELYANDNTIHGGVVKINLGKSGVNVDTIERVSYGTDGHFANVDVTYNLKEGTYRILAERAEPQSTIDLFTSTDGVNWSLAHKKIVDVGVGQYRVGTPAFHPTDENIIFFGSTAQNDSMGFKIRSLRVVDADSITTLIVENVRQAFFDAFSRGAQSLANTISSFFGPAK